MPSTYSTNLKIELMATGEKNNLWGGITNTNLGSLLEEAIVGSASVAMADANQTISITNGASSTGRCVYIKCTGALTAGRNLTVPTLNKNYIVENATTNGFDVTVKTAAGTGIAVKPSTKRAVFADTTNVVEAISGFGALTVASLASAGAVTALTVNGLTVTTTTGTFTLTNGKTFSVANTITLTGTDAATYDLGTGGAVCPAGAVISFAGSAAPTGWLLCDGSSQLRADFPALFTAIGVTYGSVDGTHFTLPDLRSRAVAGKSNMGGVDNGLLTGGTVLGAALGAQTNTATTTSTGSNAINFGSVGGQTSGGWSGFTGTQSGGDFNGLTTASISSITTNPINGSFGITVAGTSSSFSVVQPTMIMNSIIKT